MGILAVFGAALEDPILSVFGGLNSKLCPLSFPSRQEEAAVNQLHTLKYVQSFLLTPLAA